MSSNYFYYLFLTHLQDNVFVVISVCRHSSAGICNRVCGGGPGLHLQGKGKHCLDVLILFEVKLNESGSRFEAFGSDLKKMIILLSCAI